MRIVGRVRLLVGVVFVVLPTIEDWICSLAMWVPGPGENFEVEPSGWPGMTSCEEPAIVIGVPIRYRRASLVLR